MLDKAQDGNIKENGRVVEHGAKYRMIGTNLLKNSDSIEVDLSLKKKKKIKRPINPEFEIDLNF